MAEDVCGEPHSIEPEGDSDLDGLEEGLPSRLPGFREGGERALRSAE